MNQSYNAYRPQPLPLSGTHFIAPYWADFDLRGTGKIYYRQTKDPILLARATSEIQVAFRLSYRVAVTNLVIATWDAVGYYNQHTDKVQVHIRTYIRVSYVLYVVINKSQTLFTIEITY